MSLLLYAVYISLSPLNCCRKNKTVTIYRRPAKATHFMQYLYIVPLLGMSKYRQLSVGYIVYN